MNFTVVVIWFVAAALIAAASAFWVTALIDLLKREFPGENEKLIWVLVVVLTGLIGALIYWYTGRDKGSLVAA